MPALNQRNAKLKIGAIKQAIDHAAIAAVSTAEELAISANPRQKPDRKKF